MQSARSLGRFQSRSDAPEKRVSEEIAPRMGCDNPRYGSSKLEHCLDADVPAAQQRRESTRAGELLERLLHAV